MAPLRRPPSGRPLVLVALLVLAGCDVGYNEPSGSRGNAYSFTLLVADPSGTVVEQRRLLDGSYFYDDMCGCGSTTGPTDATAPFVRGPLGVSADGRTVGLDRLVWRDGQRLSDTLAVRGVLPDGSVLVTRVRRGTLRLPNGAVVPNAIREAILERVLPGGPALTLRRDTTRFDAPDRYTTTRYLTARPHDGGLAFVTVDEAHQARPDSLGGAVIDRALGATSALWNAPLDGPARLARVLGSYGSEADFDLLGVAGGMALLGRRGYSYGTPTVLRLSDGARTELAARHARLSPDGRFVLFLAPSPAEHQPSSATLHEVLTGVRTDLGLATGVGFEPDGRPLLATASGVEVVEPSGARRVLVPHAALHAAASVKEILTQPVRLADGRLAVLRYAETSR